MLADKRRVLQAAGFWFLDDDNDDVDGTGGGKGNSKGKNRVLAESSFCFPGRELAPPFHCRHHLPGCPPQEGSTSGVPSCRPLRWRVAQAEAALSACPAGVEARRALVHGGEPAALAALRSGVLLRGGAHGNGSSGSGSDSRSSSSRNGDDGGGGGGGSLDSDITAAELLQSFSSFTC